ncbi:DUF6907 domain-containing protein [Streptomyces sp. NPDC058045]|uniref:DUF6907 domain-containing protein n=1 Tax=Streptomyces sp. NPDC058045 TaxID=3346311 RepID=UPI0036EA843E
MATTFHAPVTITLPAPQATAPTRLVPAEIDGQRILVACPTWCTIDHVTEPEARLEDLTHSGNHVDLMADGFDPAADQHGDGSQLFAYACIGANPAARTPQEREAGIIISDGDGFLLRLDAAQADQFADGLVAFAAQIRGLARTLGDRGVGA